MNKLKPCLAAVFLLILNGLFAQSNAQTLPTTPITVTQKGNITLYGKKVELDNLRKELQNKLVKQATIPEEIQITYEGEVMMGMRHEVETQVSEAIAGAKWLKKSKPTVTAKSVTTTPTEFSGSKTSVSVNKKGEITLSGKKVALEDLKKELQNELVKLPTIPAEVPIKFDKNILMGTRGAVRDEVNGAIKGAKWLKKKAALEAIKIESFSKFPPEIDGCACYFSNNNAEIEAQKYIYADNYDKTAFVRINGIMEKMTLIEQNPAVKTVPNKTAKTFKNTDFEVIINIEKTGGVDEVWFYKGKMTVKNKKGQVVIKDIVGECGC